MGYTIQFNLPSFLPNSVFSPDVKAIFLIFASKKGHNKQARFPGLLKI